VIIDADALNILAMQHNWTTLVPSGALLTPHPGEFARLAGPFANGYEEWESQRQLSIRSQTYIALKRAFTSMTTPDGERYFNSTGNPGMATAGSGDVLTGILAACLSQGYAAKDALLLGVYLHGLAGDLALSAQGGQNIIAGSIIAYIQKAYATLLP
jgi:NAD(P)H-hydrate epimerase